jgi:beta-1,4-N-acetylglucosaminyltransferase
MNAAPSEGAPPARVLLVACSGGHLLQMLALKPAWEDMESKWVTLEAADSQYLLDPTNVVFAHSPTSRNIPNLLRNLVLALRTIRQFRPDVILSTGAAVAVPFFVVGRLLGVRLVYVESFTRVNRPSLSGRLVYPFADAFFVQWPNSFRRRRTRFAGSVL